MQKLSWTMEEGTIVQWLKQEGDKVTKGEDLLEVETEKVTITLEAPGTGILRKKLYSEGDIVPVGITVGIIAEPNEDITKELAEVATRRAEVATKPAEVSRESPAKAAPLTAEAPRQEVFVSPRARRLAREKGIDLSNVRGSGEGGRVVEEDILKLAQKQPPALPFTVLNTIPLSAQRKLIADRMLSSLQTKAQVTLTTETDMTEAKSLREKLGISYNDLLIRAVAIALRKHRIMNSVMSHDGLKLVEEINIGLAVSTEHGLIVPVVRNADKLSLKQIAEKTAFLVDGARAQTLGVDDISSGTFTITNLGMYPVDVNTAIVNPPQTAILAAGRVAEKPVVLEGRITARHMMTLCLTFDHRVVDGAPAAEFLGNVKEILENPSRLLEPQ